VVEGQEEGLEGRNEGRTSSSGRWGMRMHAPDVAAMAGGCSGAMMQDKWVYRGRMCEYIPVQCHLPYNGRL